MGVGGLCVPIWRYSGFLVPWVVRPDQRSELRGEVKGHRAVEVIFFIPLRWARVEQPTGSRTGGTLLLRAE